MSKVELWPTAHARAGFVAASLPTENSRPSNPAAPGHGKTRAPVCSAVEVPDEDTTKCSHSPGSTMSKVTSIFRIWRSFSEATRTVSSATRSGVDKTAPERPSCRNSMGCGGPMGFGETMGCRDSMDCRGSIDCRSSTDCEGPMEVAAAAPWNFGDPMGWRARSHELRPDGLPRRPLELQRSQWLRRRVGQTRWAGEGSRDGAGAHVLVAGAAERTFLLGDT